MLCIQEMTVSIKFNSDQFKSGKFIVLIFLKKKVLVTPTTVFKKATFPTAGLQRASQNTTATSNRPEVNIHSSENAKTKIQIST